MKTRIILSLLCLISLNAMGQGTITRQKCKTCGKVISQCQYRGKHPKPQPAKTVDSQNSQGKKVNKAKTWGSENDPFYIVMGVNIGKTTKQEAKAKGYVIKDYDTYSTMEIPSSRVADSPTFHFDENDIVNEVNIMGFNVWPSNWKKIGLNGNMSFHEFRSFFTGKGWRFTYEKNIYDNGNNKNIVYRAYSPTEDYYIWGFFIYGYGEFEFDKPGYFNSMYFKAIRK